MDKLVLNVKEISQILGISRPVAYELVKREGLAIKISERRIVVPVAALKAWLQEQSREARL